MSAEPSSLERLSTIERALLQAFRTCSPEHQKDVYDLAMTAALKSIAPLAGKVIHLKRI